MHRLRIVIGDPGVIGVIRDLGVIGVIRDLGLDR